MSACTEVRKWITENITVPVERWVERAEETCEEVSRWVEREIREPIETRRERTERRCREQDCDWWCACCNKWFCWLETIVEIVVEWVVRVVGEWLVETVCKIVVKLIKIVVEVVVTVGKFIVVGVTCLFTDWQGLLDSVIDLWYDLINIVEDVLDLVDYVLGQVVDLLDITKDMLDKLADHFGWLGWIFGIIAGVLDGIRRIIEGVRQIVVGIIQAVIDILRLDFCAFVEDLAYGLSGLGNVITGVLGAVLVGAGGIRDWAKHNEVRDAIRSVLEANFSGDELEQIKAGIALESSTYGAPWTILPFRLQIRSRGALDLRALHEEGLLDLYGAAGYGPTCRRKFFNHGQLDVVYEGTSRAVAYSDIRLFLAGEEVPSFVVISVKRAVFDKQMKMARKKARQLGLKFEWDGYELFTISRREQFLLPDLGDDTAAAIVSDVMGGGAPANYCRLPMICVFGYEAGNFGFAEADWISSGSTTRFHIGATWRDFRPELVFLTVPIHEAGHCFDLKHDGHDGADNIMFTAAGSAGLDFVTLQTFAEYLALGGEPQFTVADATTAWTWIVAKAGECLPRVEEEPLRTPPPPPPPEPAGKPKPPAGGPER